MGALSPAADGGQDAGTDPDAVDAGPLDARAPDAGAPDAGAADASALDAGAPDSGAPDSGAPDSGAPDSGAADSGGPPDAGSTDATLPDGSWRSELFPANWRPVHAGGAATADGRFLHDFSFAGYHRGDVDPPVGVGAATRTVDAATFGNGTAEATAGIQAAIDAVCAAGGGVVQLSSGTFLLKFPATAGAPALRIACSRLVLRGSGAAGAGATQLLLDHATNARQRAMILVRPASFSFWAGDSTHPENPVTQDILLPTRVLPVDSVSGFTAGDAVAVRTNLTAAFRAEHHMDAASTGAGDYWPASTPASLGLIYLRRVAAVDAAAKTLTLDAPTRYPMKTRDSARVYLTRGYLEEVGLEAFAFGMREHATSAAGTQPGPLGDLADADYDTAGTAAYDVHSTSAIRLEGVRDGWVAGLRTFSPAGNPSGAHVLSTALFVVDTATRITVRDCQFESPQYRGGGGNGYLFLVQGSDTLVRDNVAIAGRHNFIVSSMTASGNVFLSDRTVNPRYSDDTHRNLSQAMLYDALVLDSAWLQAANRGTDSNSGGFTTTQTVFWNTSVLKNHPITFRSGHSAGSAIETSQWGFGYAIGTRAQAGASAAVSLATYTNSLYAAQDPGLPRDFVEGEGLGATLVPQSLYLEQLAMRRARGE